MEYTRNAYVPASMCDGATKLSILSAFQLVEDSVTELMGDLHIDGITAMREYGAMWVFVKNHIRILRRPDWREEFAIRCFVSGHTAAKLLIDTELLSRSGEPLLRSRLELCALDLESGRIRKASTVGVTEDILCGEPLPEVAFTRFPKGTPAALEEVTVRATNLDYCSHTNNIEYVRFILNTYCADDFKKREVDGIEMHYGSQSYEGDRLLVSRFAAEGEDYFAIRREEDTIADCRIAWSGA